MKKVLGSILVVIGIVVCGCAFEDTNHYTKEVTVFSVEDNMVTFEDRGHHFWKWESAENDVKEFKKYQKVQLKMYNNNTDDIEDDIIEKVVVK